MNAKELELELGLLNNKVREQADKDIQSDTSNQNLNNQPPQPNLSPNIV